MNFDTIKYINYTFLIASAALISVSCEKNVPFTPRGVEANQMGRLVYGGYVYSHLIAITWIYAEGSGADGYNIYRSSSASGPYTKIGDVKGPIHTYGRAGSSSGGWVVTVHTDPKPPTIFLDLNPLPGANYYRVSAFNRTGESNKSAYALCEFSMPEPEAEQSGSTIVITWAEMSWAKSYIVYRSSSALGPYSSIGETVETSFTDANPLVGINFYRIAPVDDDGEGEHSGFVSCEFMPI